MGSNLQGKLFYVEEGRFLEKMKPSKVECEALMLFISDKIIGYKQSLKIS